MRTEMMWLRDILESTECIEAYVENETFESFELDGKCQDAVLRRLIVIGEAVSRLSEATRSSLPEIPWVKIRAMRNVVIHQYFDVEPETIWDTARKRVPELADAIRPLLPNED